MWVEQVYGPDGPTGEFLYHVVSQILVRVRDLDMTGDVLGAALAAGVNNVGGIRFGVEDTQALEVAARDAAVDNAMAKAEQLAERLGGQRGQRAARHRGPRGTSRKSPALSEQMALDAARRKRAGFSRRLHGPRVREHCVRHRVLVPARRQTDVVVQGALGIVSGAAPFHGPVAQWIERWFPKPCAPVRVRAGLPRRAGLERCGFRTCRRSASCQSPASCGRVPA